ncbi:unnamed protein product [Caenorhabditis nigoni]
MTQLFVDNVKVQCDFSINQPTIGTCSPDALPPLSPGENVNEIPVTSSGLTVTPIPNTMDTTSTMTVSCTAANGLGAFMIFEPSGNGPPENQGNPQTVAVTFSCSSVDMVWNYFADGQPWPPPITLIRCQQAGSG